MLAGEIRAIVNAKQNTIDEIKKEVVDGFRRYCDAGKMDAWIKKWLLTDEAVARGTFDISTKYEHYSRYGFSCGGYFWENPDKCGWEYRGVSLSVIQEAICTRLNRELRDYLMEQGFSESGIYTRYNDKSKRYDTTVTL